MKPGFLIALLINVVNCYSQGNYMVYRLKGNVWETGSKSRKLLRVGQLVRSNTALWLDKGSRVSLICENYATLMIVKNGGYVLGKHEGECAVESHSVSADYFKFIWNELTHPHESPEDNRRKYMHNAGAVTRGCPGVLVDHVFDTVNNSGESIYLTWKTDLSNNRVSFSLYDEEKYGELLFTAAVIRNSVCLDTIRKYAAGRENVYWSVNVDGNEVCPRKLIRFWPVARFDRFVNGFKDSLPPGMDTAEWNYMLGFCLESNSFIAEAYRYYKMALRLDPGEKKYARTVHELKMVLERN